MTISRVFCIAFWCLYSITAKLCTYMKLQVWLIKSLSQVWRRSKNAYVKQWVVYDLLSLRRLSSSSDNSIENIAPIYYEAIHP